MTNTWLEVKFLKCECLTLLSNERIFGCPADVIEAIFIDFRQQLSSIEFPIAKENYFGHLRNQRCDLVNQLNMVHL